MNATPSLDAPPADAAYAAIAGRSHVPILLVDDDPAKRLALKAVLRPLGYPVVEAESGLDALRCVMDQDVAVILLDVMMPIMDGFETAELIRQRQSSETTPIIFITAHAEDEIVNLDLYAQGAVDFIFAPVAPHELRAKVSVFANLFIKAENLAAEAQAVQTSADHLRLLTDATPAGIFHTDSDNRYVYTNARWTEITGIPAEDAIGQRWDSITGSASPDGAEGSVELSRRFEIPAPGSGSKTVLATSKSVLDGDGGIAGWAGTLVDVP